MATFIEQIQEMGLKQAFIAKTDEVVETFVTGRDERQ